MLPWRASWAFPKLGRAVDASQRNNQGTKPADADSVVAERVAAGRLTAGRLTCPTVGAGWAFVGAISNRRAFRKSLEESVGLTPMPEPMMGKRVVVTRPRAQAGTLAEKLAALGAVPILFPTIELAPMDDDAPLLAALARLTDYDCVVFTSANGVAVFCRQALSRGVQLNTPTRRFAAVCPATARALEQRGLRAAFIPDEYLAEALAAGLGEGAGRRVLLPHAALARAALAA